MKFIKVAGIVWGFFYFALGAMFSFSLGGEDFWKGAVVYLALFFLPLPLAIAALWFPRTAGAALIVCVVVSVAVSAISTVSSNQTPDLAGLCKFTMYHVPHIVFGLAYINSGRIKKQGDSTQEGRSVGVV